jgi:hypothetical protein
MPTALETAQSRLEAYLARETALLSAGQEYTVGTRRRRDVELAEVRAAIKDLQAEVASLGESASGQSRLHIGVPR